MSTGSRCSTLGETKKRLTPSWLGEVAERFVVLAGEVVGRFSAETAQFISRRRWSALLSFAAARAFASSLLDGRASVGVDGVTPNVQEVLAAARHLG